MRSSSSHHSHHHHHHRNAPSHRGSWNVVILFCLSMLLTGIMFQRATTSVTRTDNEIKAATTATDTALVNGEKSFDSLNEKKYTPEITQIISNILNQAKDAINSVGQPNDNEGIIDNPNAPTSIDSISPRYDMDEQEASRLVKTLLNRVKTALTWASTLNKSVNRFDRIANGTTSRPCSLTLPYKLPTLNQPTNPALTTLLYHTNYLLSTNQPCPYNLTLPYKLPTLNKPTNPALTLSLSVQARFISCTNFILSTNQPYPYSFCTLL